MVALKVTWDVFNEPIRGRFILQVHHFQLSGVFPIVISYVVVAF